MKPKDCTPGKDCIYAMSFVADDERIYFELLGQVSAERNSYVALGFSVDGLMVDYKIFVYNFVPFLPSTGWGYGHVLFLI
jgi:hypothetical protein